MPKPKPNTLAYELATIRGRAILAAGGKLSGRIPIRIPETLDRRDPFKELRECIAKSGMIIVVAAPDEKDRGCLVFCTLDAKMVWFAPEDERHHWEQIRDVLSNPSLIKLVPHELYEELKCFDSIVPARMLGFAEDGRSREGIEGIRKHLPDHATTLLAPFEAVSWRAPHVRDRMMLRERPSLAPVKRFVVGVVHAMIVAVVKHLERVCQRNELDGPASTIDAVIVRVLREFFPDALPVLAPRAAHRGGEDEEDDDQGMETDEDGFFTRSEASITEDENETQGVEDPGFGEEESEVRSGVKFSNKVEVAAYERDGRGTLTNSERSVERRRKPEMETAMDMPVAVRNYGAEPPTFGEYWEDNELMECANSPVSVEGYVRDLEPPPAPERSALKPERQRRRWRSRTPEYCVSPVTPPSRSDSPVEIDGKFYDRERSETARGRSRRRSPPPPAIDPNYNRSCVPKPLDYARSGSPPYLPSGKKKYRRSIRVQRDPRDELRREWLHSETRERLRCFPNEAQKISRINIMDSPVPNIKASLMKPRSVWDRLEKRSSRDRSSPTTTRRSKSSGEKTRRSRTRSRSPTVRKTSRDRSSPTTTGRSRSSRARIRKSRSRSPTTLKRSRDPTTSGARAACECFCSRSKVASLSHGQQPSENPTARTHVHSKPKHAATSSPSTRTRSPIPSTCTQSSKQTVMPKQSNRRDPFKLPSHSKQIQKDRSLHPGKSGTPTSVLVKAKKRAILNRLGPKGAADLTSLTSRGPLQQPPTKARLRRERRGQLRAMDEGRRVYQWKDSLMEYWADSQNSSDTDG